MWDNNKRANIHIIRVDEGKERKRRIDKELEVTVSENFPNLAKDINPQLQKAERIPGRINPKEFMLIHIIMKTSEN